MDRLLTQLVISPGKYPPPEGSAGRWKYCIYHILVKALSDLCSVGGNCMDSEEK